MTEDSLNVYYSVSGRTLTFDKPAVILFSPLGQIGKKWAVEKKDIYKYIGTWDAPLFASW